MTKMAMLLTNGFLIKIPPFHRIGPLGRFGLVVVMSVLMYVSCPLQQVF